jgi:hypothetical protein
MNTLLLNIGLPPNILVKVAHTFFRPLLAQLFDPASKAQIIGLTILLLFIISTAEIILMQIFRLVRIILITMSMSVLMLELVCRFQIETELKCQAGSKSQQEAIERGAEGVHTELSGLRYMVGAWQSDTNEQNLVHNDEEVKTEARELEDCI